MKNKSQNVSLVLEWDKDRKVIFQGVGFDGINIKDPFMLRYIKFVGTGELTYRDLEKDED